MDPNGMESKAEQTKNNIVLKRFPDLQHFASGNLYGLSNFVKALKEEEVDIGLVAELITSYDPIKEVAKVRGRDIYVNESRPLPVCAQMDNDADDAGGSESMSSSRGNPDLNLKNNDFTRGRTGSANKSVSSVLLPVKELPGGLNWLRNNSANKDIYLDRVGRVDLLDRHPATIIHSIYSGHLLHCILDTCKYYLYYYMVLNEAEYTVGYGYHQIEDHSKGVWESTKYSEVFPCNLSDHTTRLGEKQ
ncbi:hypothetical protein Tco_0949629 [Tanacetum coccineum]